MLRLNEAYSTLSNPDKRRAHDDWIARTEREEQSQKARAEGSRPPPPPKAPPRPAPNQPEPTPVYAPPRTRTVRKQALGPVLPLSIVLGALILFLIYTLMDYYHSDSASVATTRSVTQSANGDVPQSEAELVKKYRTAAQQGDASAQHNLGLAYALGKGVAKNYTEALKWSRLAAQQGNAAAQSNVGVMYQFGNGVPQDLAEAVKWYRRAAEQGNAQGQSHLGELYLDGLGVPRNYVGALKWLRLAAQQGNSRAQANLGYMYLDGKGVPQNYPGALKWSRNAAQHGDFLAQNNLGFMYQTGKGVPLNYAEAMKWFRLAAQQGSADSQFAVGIMYEVGQGVPQNYAEAMKWFRLAAQQGNAYGQESIGEMYNSGHGVPKDFAEASQWYRLAAQQGNARAQTGLAIMYINGQGVPRDLIVAYALFTLGSASSDGNKDFDAQETPASLRQRLMTFMNPGQIQAGQELAHQMGRSGVLKTLDAHFHTAEQVELRKTAALNDMSPEPNDSDISGVVQKTLTVYGENGLAGLISVSQSCYKAETNKLKCIEFDITASQIDSGFARSMGVNRNAYYADNQFFTRATPVFVNSGMNMQQSNTYINVATKKISRLLPLDMTKAGTN